MIKLHKLSILVSHGADVQTEKIFLRNVCSLDSQLYHVCHEIRKSTGGLDPPSPAVISNKPICSIWQLMFSVNLKLINTVDCCFLGKVVQPVKAKKRKSVTFSDTLVNGSSIKKRSPQTSDGRKTQNGDSLMKDSDDDNLPVFRVSLVKADSHLQILVRFSTLL